MSFQAMAWAVDQPVKGLGKLVLLLLANYTSRDGICFPSQKELATQCGITDRAVRTWLDKLEEGGFIARQQRRRVDGTRTTDHIILALPKQAEPGSGSDAIKRNVVPSKRNLVPGKRDEPITEPITKRENPILKKKWETLLHNLDGVISADRAPRRRPLERTA